MRSFRLSRLRLASMLALLLTLPAAAAVTPAPADNAYRTPPQTLVDIIDAPPTPSVALDPHRQWLLVQDRPSLPPVAELAERELRLGGLRIRPRTHAPSRASYITGLRLVRLSDLSERPISGLPEGSRLGDLAWSPDGARVAFTNLRQDGAELWVADLSTGAARRLAGGLNLTASVEPRWLADSQTLVCALVDPSLGPEPAASDVPTGPVIRESTG
ncbi:MAG: S9 family peptidase, partial [Acidobacteria bacterium]